MNFLNHLSAPPKPTQAQEAISQRIPITDGIFETTLIVDRNLMKTSICPRLSKFNLQACTSKPMKRVLCTSFENDTGLFHGGFKNQFIGMAKFSFDRHVGFALNPGHLFLLICQQVALHVNQHPEELRDRFVHHEGKKELTLMVPAYPTKQEWTGIIKDFQSQIQENTVADTYELFNQRDFTCSSEIEQIAGDVCLMDLCQEFFSYTMITSCGIPYFKLEGMVEDWELLREKAEEILNRKTLPEFSSYWKPILLPLLDKLLLQRKEEESVDVKFWDDFFLEKRVGGYGSGKPTYMTGWINCFFPIVGERKTALRRNPFCVHYSESSVIPEEIGKGKQDFSLGVSLAPVKWIRDWEKLEMIFCSGFVGGQIIHDNCIRPEVGWWIGML
jgi:hypothetical protein